jgi:hypothetical protein
MGLFGSGDDKGDVAHLVGTFRSERRKKDLGTSGVRRLALLCPASDSPVVSSHRPHADLVQGHEASDVHNREHVHSDRESKSHDPLPAITPPN